MLKPPPRRPEIDTRPFPQRIGPAFTYPFRGNSGMMLLMTSLFVFLVYFLAVLFPPFFLVYLLMLVWFFAWMYQVLAQSAQGVAEVPEVPLATDVWDDLLRPAIFFASAWAICFAPMLLAMYLANLADGSLVIPLLSIVGHILLPMVLLVIVLFETPLAGLRPDLVFGGIMKMPLDYAVMLVITAAVPALAYSAVAMLGPLGGLFIVPLVIYLWVVEMRLIGQLYHAHRHDLGWFLETL